jgi:hypothetical protein
LLALLAPAAAVNLLHGQNGFLTAALMIGGIGLARWRPVTRQVAFCTGIDRLV